MVKEAFQDVLGCFRWFLRDYRFQRVPGGSRGVEKRFRAFPGVSEGV